ATARTRPPSWDSRRWSTRTSLPAFPRTAGIAPSSTTPPAPTPSTSSSPTARTASPTENPISTGPSATSEPMIARDARNSAVRRGVRDGLTLLEVVVATAMLATLGVAVMGAISFMQYYNQQSRYRLDGMEVAHRLVTQYIDDRD